MRMDTQNAPEGLGFSLGKLFLWCPVQEASQLKQSQRGWNCIFTLKSAGTPVFVHVHFAISWDALS